MNVIPYLYIHIWKRATNSSANTKLGAAALQFIKQLATSIELKLDQKLIFY